VKYAWMEKHSADYALAEMYGALNVSISGYPIRVVVFIADV